MVSTKFVKLNVISAQAGIFFLRPKIVIFATMTLVGSICDDDFRQY